MSPDTPSFRTRILLVVLTVAVIPLALIGLWLTRSASRSGEELLRTRLEEALERTVARIGSNWLKQRSDLLFIGEDDAVQQALLAGETPASTPPISARERFDSLDESIRSVSILDLAGTTLWTLNRDEELRGPSRPATLRVELPVHQRFPSRELGRLVVDLGAGGLLGDPGGSPALAGMLLSLVDANRGVALLPLPFDPGLMTGETFSWGDDDWLTVRQQMTEPPLVLVVAGPLSAFAGPFEDAARQGTLLLAVVALAGLAAAWLLSRRLTRSLDRLVVAADAVSRGELEAQVQEAGNDEVGRVAQAFNTMTASLRHTLAELADRERLAAVGEFAATLAHEVRNPLTAIRIDLQRVEERLPDDSPLREPQARALREISRLDATVSETLDVARNGRWGAAPIDLAVPLRAAAEAASPAYDERNATLDARSLAARLPSVRGDVSTLEQLFLNLLLNAAAALGPGGRAWIEVEENAEHAVVRIRDTGTGIPPEMLERVFQPLYTTRPDGTGLGLTVAQRIVEQHEGAIEIESEVGEGTTVVVQLPLGRAAAGTGGGAV